MRKLSALLWFMVGLSSAAALLAPSQAQAFCGFYVSGAKGKLYNDATQVVMMREGTKTVLSMQNNYSGPPKDFAMVVPVPVVLQEENVKTLDRNVFDKIDQLASPRLVEYFEQNPCYVHPPVKRVKAKSSLKLDSSTSSSAAPEDRGVTIEAKFSVGEYNILILSAKESNGLETWLKENKYNIPDGAASAMQSYIQQGMYFFVAKVDIKKVRQRTLNGKQVAELSPLRFHYDSDNFSLPVRLGLLNAKGKQDLIIHILAKQRYEAANLKNVTIPTNLIVSQAVRHKFAQFYTALFDYTLEQEPGAMVTEYAWDASTCDPCPGPTLDFDDLETFGNDVISPKHPVPDQTPSKINSFQQQLPLARKMARRWRRPAGGWVLTRLHTRYDAKTLKDDIVFQRATAIVGGRGTPQGRAGELPEEGSQASHTNNFQGRYIMLNPWKGKVTCKDPSWGDWGGNPNKLAPSSSTTVARDLAYTPRGKIKLKKVIKSKDAPGLKL